jgi:hypothetical protein
VAAFFSKHEEAEGTVVYSEICDHSPYAFRKFEIIVDVAPADGVAFRGTAHHVFPALAAHPTVGDTVRVRFDGKRTKLDLVTKGDIRWDLDMQEDAQRSRRDSVRSGDAGTPPPPSGRELTHAAQLASMENAVMRRELEQTGAAGRGRIERIEERDTACPPLASYAVTVAVTPASGAPFERSFTTWINTNTRQLAVGDELPVRYDLADDTRIAFTARP